MRGRGWIVAMVVGGLIATPGLGAATAAPGAARQAAALDRSDLELLSVTIDQTGEQGPADWQVGNASTTWTPYFGTATYSYPMPSAIPASGMSVTISITAHGNPPNRMAPAMGLRGELVASDGDLGTLAESGQSNAASKSVTLQPGAYNPGFTVDLLVGLQDGPHITYHYVAVRPQQCRSPSFCNAALPANKPSTVPDLDKVTSYQVPKLGGTEVLAFPNLPDSATGATVTLSATDDHGRPGAITWIAGTEVTLQNAQRAVTLCGLLAFVGDSETDRRYGSALSDVQPSFTQCLATVVKILRRHDELVAKRSAAQQAHARGAQLVAGCRTVLRGKGKGYVRVSCAATRAGIRITYRAVGAGVTLKSVLTGKPRLIVSRSKYATKTKRLRVLWHATG